MPLFPFLNPDPVTHLVGHSNKAPVIVDGQEMTALIDLGAQVSRISSQFCRDLVLQIQPLGQLLEQEETGGSTIPYLGFLEANLKIPGIKTYNEDVLLLVIPSTNYSETVPVVVGSKIMDRAMSLMTKGELAKASSFWSCPVWVTAATLHKLKQNWGKKRGKPLLSEGWPCGG